MNLVALRLDASHKGKNNPIYPLLESGCISKYIYNRIELTVIFLNAWWSLIQSSFHFIQPELERQGFKHLCGSAFETFAWFVRSMIDEDFAVCLTKYYEASSRKIVKQYRQSKKLFKGEGTLVQQKPVQAKDSKEEFDIVLLLILTTCYSRATRNEVALKSSLDALITAAINLGDYTAKRCWHEGSHAWKDGKLGKGDKDGIYKFS